MSTDLFGRLTGRADALGQPIDAPQAIRYIRRASEDDAELMRRAEVSSLVLTRQVRMVRLSYGGRTTFCVFGLPPPVELPPGLEVVPLTPGVFAASVLQADVFPSHLTTAAQIRDAIEAQYQTATNGYEGHELDAIAALFPPTLTLSVALDEAFHQSDHRTLGALVTRGYVDGPISLNEKVIGAIASLFETGSTYVPFHNVLQGVLAISWHHLYLELYRCLEQLYSAPRVSALREVWSSTSPTFELAKRLETHLAWRPKEDEALGHVLAACPASLILAACDVLGVSKALDQHNARAEGCARKIYSLRNSIVHHRPVHEIIDKTDEEWNEIILLLLDFIRETYSHFGRRFFDAPGAVSSGVVKKAQHIPWWRMEKTRGGFRRRD